MNVFKFIILALLISSTQLLAAESSQLGICADSVVKTYPGRERPDYYGNAQIDSFRCAISGSTQLTPEQMQQRKDLIPDSHDFRFYGRVGLNAAAQQIRFPSAKATQSSNQFDVALGYRWKVSSVELEWLNLSSIQYNLQAQIGTPVSNAQLAGTLKGQALFLAVNYEFYKFYNYIPYFNLAIGITNAKATLSINGGQTQSLNKYVPAGGLGIGVKFNIYSRFYADIMVRGLYLGQTKYDASNVQAGLSIKAKRIWLGASLGVIWLF